MLPLPGSECLPAAVVAMRSSLCSRCPKQVPCVTADWNRFGRVGQDGSHSMKRGWAIRRAGFWDPATAFDLVLLDAGDRHRRRIMLKCEQGTEFLLDLDEAVAEIAVRTSLALVQLAWHLGNRHTDVQIFGDRLRIRRDHVLEEMAAGLGAKVTAIDAPFDPEAGAPHHEHD